MATAVLAVAVLSIIAVQIFVFRGQQKSRGNVEANVLASTLMNNLASKLKTSLDTVVATGGPVAVSPSFLVEPTNQYTYQIDESWQGAATDRLKRVQLRLFWSDSQGSHDLQVWSMYTD